MSRHVILLPIAMILIAAPLARAAEKSDASTQDAVIRKVITTLEENFNRGDSKGLAACWTPDGEFLGPSGERIEGRTQIETAFRDFLAAHQNAKLRLGVTSVRPIADDVALVDFVPAMTPIPEGMDAEPASSMVLVKREGRWLVGSIHETGGSVPSHHLHLQGLKWLVGQWASEADPSAGISVQTTCDWTANGSFLIRKFHAEGKTETLRAGTEVIGWDPRTRQIRSWSFDADGGFGESAWTQDGDRWIVKYVGTPAEGGSISATHVVTLVDANTLTIQSKDRTLNGEKQPDSPEVTIKRGPAESEAKPKSSEPPATPQHVLP